MEASASGATWWMYIAFFGSHIPITLAIDAQAVLPVFIFPKLLRDLLSWHVEIHNDILMGLKPTWFKGIVWAEVLLQLPFFFVAFWSLLVGKDRAISLEFCIYASHVVTTMIPILYSFITTDTFATEAQRWILLAIYAPYLFIPLHILTYYASQIYIDLKKVHRKKKH
mmetsp:Transcript_34953/g.48643  ORF Transcript_34953/g.48643 Transcript_34953/m.48643 type:complete len:168 (-) Transcript_34953:226-729(-)